jgi:hypothetical protein
MSALHQALERKKINPKPQEAMERVGRYGSSGRVLV